MPSPRAEVASRTALEEASVIAKTVEQYPSEDLDLLLNKPSTSGHLAQYSGSHY